MPQLQEQELEVKVFFDTTNLRATIPNTFGSGSVMGHSQDCVWCLLGALGDICIMLPLFYDIFQHNKTKPQVIVSQNYAPMFEGVTYVDPIVYPHKYDRNDKQMTQKIADFVRQYSQTKPLVFLNPIECPDGRPPQTTNSFVNEFWKIAGRADEMNKFPLIFDNRDEKREKELVEKVCPDPDKPVILAALTGMTSPFPQKNDLLQLLKDAFPDAQIVNLEDVRAERPYDLLGLFDAARVLVSVDTMHLHLSRASAVPVVAIARDYHTNWNGTPWNKRFQFHCRYGQYDQRRYELLAAIQDIFDGTPRPQTKPVFNLSQQNGYNPSIITHGGDLLMSYRFHPSQHWMTKLRMAKLDKELNSAQDWPINMPQEFYGASIEDMRMFHMGDSLYGAYVVSKPDGIRANGRSFPTCVVGYGELKYVGDSWIIEKHIQPKYGKNDWTGYEKNWVPFMHGTKLCFIYSSSPENIVIEVEGDEVVNKYTSKSLPWAWGEIRGGTPPIDFKGYQLRFFHSSFHHTESRETWRYHIGCCVVNPDPPFEMMFISSSPILSGHEWRNPNAHHQKQNVAIPYGVVKEGEDTLLLSVGVNDSASCIVRLNERQLRL